MILRHTSEIRLSKHSSIIFSSILGNIFICENNNKINIITLTTRKIKPARSSTLNRAKKEILEYLSSHREKFGFKVFPEGTVFQKIVWKKLQNIKYGNICNYSDIATSINSSPRAVGKACAFNKCLFLIPCHRVVASNGELRGFSAIGGLLSKKKLLFVEKVIPNTRGKYKPIKAKLR